MTMESDSVFSSGITRGRVPNTKDLYNLINIDPAIPVKPHVEQLKQIDFQPKIGKLYVPKKKSKHKVKTVRNIRCLYENDILSFLPHDLEKQHNYLLRKFKKGYAQKATTKAYAESLLKSNRPISRQSWQMLINVNPNAKPHSIQYVLWNGVPIRVNGSKGGKTKYLCKYDLGRNTPLQNKLPLHHRKVLGFKNKQKLLENSVNVKFRPGPRSKKIYLDESFQKHQIGFTELVKLPTPVLDIYPSSYGITFDETTRCVLNSLRDVDGKISETWAAFATSALGSNKNGKLEKSPSDCIPFELNYKKKQKHILMRKNCHKMPAQNEEILLSNNQQDIKSAVREVVNALLDSVEISLQQDILTFDEDDIREIESSTCTLNNTKDKTKKKFSELDRLHVTVIELPDETSEEKTIKCENSFCQLGCICPSLECRKILRRHCGRVRCMFSCKCDHSMYKIDNSNSEILNELVNLDKQICSKLSKEEQKFHQTVVLTGEQSIILKSNRRDSKAPKKYDDFHSNIKNKVVNHKLLSVSSFKINCANVEPWCMVHNLYKCFCGGKFVDGFALSTDQSPQEMTIDEEHIISTETSYKRERRNTVVEKAKSDLKTKTSIDSVPVYSIENESSSDSFEQYPEKSECSRFIPYTGRKYSHAYYTTTNFKIRAMEQNDKTLHKRLISLVFKNEIQEPPAKKQNIFTNAVFTDESKTELNKESCLLVKNDSKADKVATPPPSICIIDSDTDNSLDEQKEDISIKNLNNAVNTINLNNPAYGKSNLIRWLENSYKVYKKRLEEGNIKNSLDPPKQGIMALYPWEFLLTRYRESKNLFLVTKTKPYRIFMAVSMKNPFFKNCINIDDIRFSDLHNYPVTVKNLLTNVTNLVDHFYIFRGLSFCWELIGSVSKINEKKNEVPNEDENENEELEDISRLTFDAGDKEDSNCAISDQFNSFLVSTDSDATLTQTQITETNDSSRWFVMTLENDFSEIQFYKKGFFVKYESIMKAIRVARISGNTVRLSSKGCLDKGTIPPFGIHAIPSTEEYLVFIGPYEKDEPLGIETIHKILDVKKSKRTRGVWITTNKIDNLNVIKKPLSFMPAKDTNQIVQLHDTESHNKSNKTSNFRNSSPQKLTRNKKNDNTILSQLYSENSTSSAEPDLTFNPESSKTVIIAPDNITLPRQPNESECKDAGTSNKISKDGRVSKPIAEIAPQMKIMPESQKPTTQRPEIGMFILKPEEINKKAMENRLFTNPNDVTDEDETDAMNADIEDFLATSRICAPPTNLKEDWNNVMIECTTVNCLGWIAGRQRSDGYLSIEFPGFKESPFYKEEVAFAKLNQVLERKVFIPNDLCLKWRVVTSEKDLSSKLRLQQEHMGPGFVLTRRGFRLGKSFLPHASLQNSNSKASVYDLLATQTSQSDVTEPEAFEEIEDTPSTANE